MKATYAIAAALLVSVALFAQQGMQKPTPPAAPAGQMSMDDMMKQCREHCQAASKSVDETLAAVQAAKESNDPAKMRAALEQVEKPLAQMKDHMGMCMKMMDMMQMHSQMMGGRMGGMMQGGQTGSLDIALRTEPDPLRSGQNTFEVTVKSADGQPVTDADVSVQFFMAAMPAMNMPEMRNTVTLRHVAAGRYRGTGNVAMAGRWEVTVVVAKGGKEIGSRKLTVTVK